MSISANVLSIGSPQSQVHPLVAFSSQPTKLNVLRQVVE